MINPPKKKPSRKHSKTAKKKIHRILALEGKGGGLFTSSQAKIVRKGIKLNPFHRFRSNPLGEELMFVGLNPMKGGHKMASRKHHKKHRKNPVKRHKRYHRNPMSSVKSLIPMAVSGGLGALTGRAVPQFIPVLNNMGTIGNIISKLALAFGGAMLIDKLGLEKRLPIIFNANGWVIGSVASGVADSTAIGIVKATEGLGLFVDNGRLAPYSPGVGEFIEDSGASPFSDENGVYAG